jgi:hypothetical protein
MRPPFSKFHIRTYPADAGFLISFFNDVRTGIKTGPAIIKIRKVPQNLFFRTIRNNLKTPSTRLPATRALTKRFSEKLELDVPRFLFNTLVMDETFARICPIDRRVRFITLMMDIPSVLPTDVNVATGRSNRLIGL